MANIYKQGNILDYTPGSRVEPGIIVQHPSGQLGIVIGDGIDANATGSVQTDVLVEVNNPDGVTATAGSAIGYIAASDKLVAAAGGDFDLNSVVYTGSGTNPVVCRMNAKT